MSRMDLDDEPANGLKRDLEEDEAEEEEEAETEGEGGHSPKRYRRDGPADSASPPDFSSPPALSPSPADGDVCPSPGLGLRSPPFFSGLVERLGSASSQWASPFRAAAPTKAAPPRPAPAAAPREPASLRPTTQQSSAPPLASTVKLPPSKAIPLPSSLLLPSWWSWRRAAALSLVLLLVGWWWGRPRHCSSGAAPEGGCIPCDPEGECQLGLLACKPRSKRIGDRCVPCVVFPDKLPCLPDAALAEDSELAMESVLAHLVDNACGQLARGAPLARAALPSQFLKTAARQATGLSGDRFEEVWTFTLTSLRQQAVSWSGVAVPHPEDNNWLLWRMPLSAPFPCVVAWLRGLARQAVWPVVGVLLAVPLLLRLWRWFGRYRRAVQQTRFLIEVVLNSLESLAGQPFAVSGVQRTLEEEYGAQVEVATLWPDVCRAVETDTHVTVQTTPDGPAWAWAAPEGSVEG